MAAYKCLENSCICRYDIHIISYGILRILCIVIGHEFYSIFFVDIDQNACLWTEWFDIDTPCNSGFELEPEQKFDNSIELKECQGQFLQDQTFESDFEP